MTIEKMLLRIAELLDAHGRTDWANAFRALHADFIAAPEQTKGNIRSLYGGMGSFNDIILYSSNGHVLSSENTELDQLRSDLFAACRP